MSRYARGKYAYAICDRSGFKVRYKDLRTEWTGMRVHKSEWEEQHPQLTPPRIVRDAQVLYAPRPDNDTMGDPVSQQLEEVISMTHGAT